MTNPLHDALIGQQPAPAHPFLIAADGAITSYADIDRESARLANALVAAGVAPGDRVAVQVEKSAAALALYLATVRAGAVFLPLNTAYTPDEIGYFFGDAEPALVVCDPARFEATRAAAGTAQVMTLGADGTTGSLIEAKEAQPDSHAPVARNADDLAAILYTSGTTGRSKGAMLSQRNLLSNARTLRDYWRVTADDVRLHALPIFHTHGLFVATNTLMLAGAAMIFLPRFDAEQAIGLLPRATMMMGVPTFYTRLLDRADFTRDAAAGMRLFISGSAPLLAETNRAFERMSCWRLASA